MLNAEKDADKLLAFFALTRTGICANRNDVVALFRSRPSSSDARATTLPLNLVENPLRRGAREMVERPGVKKGLARGPL
jgi:hypothetical protein